METDESTRNFVNLLCAAGVTGEQCDEPTVRDLERQLGLALPAAYREFLLTAGRGFPTWAGSQHAIDDDLPELQRSGKRLLEGCGGRLPADAFVFLIHQGDGDDPAVYQWVDLAEPEPIEGVGRNFTGFVAESRRELEDWLARRPGAHGQAPQWTEEV